MVYLYGAGTYGTLTQKILEKQGVFITAFIDRRLAGQMINNIPVISIEQLTVKNDDVIYITAKNSYTDMKSDLIRCGCHDIRNIVSLLENVGGDLELTSKEQDALQQRKSYIIAVKMDEINGIKLNHVELVVTEKCSLKCKGCSSLMPYYAAPQSKDYKSIILYYNNLIEAIDYIGEIRILGGSRF